MSFYTTSHHGVIDRVTDANSIIKRRPSMAKVYDAIAETRKMYEDERQIVNGAELVGWTKDRSMVHIAQVPVPVMAALLYENPEAVKDSKSFHAWLALHPECRVGYTRIR